MNNNPRRRRLLNDTSVAVLIFLLINILTVTSPLAYLLAPVLLPVFLLYVLASGGQSAFLLTALVGVIPYFVLGDGRSTLAMLLPVVLMLGAQYFILRSRPASAWALTLTSVTALAGTLLNGFLSIYVLQASDFFRFSSQVAQTIQSEFMATISSGPYELPPSQAEAIRALAATITPEFVQDLIPAIVIAWSLAAGYFALRLARRFLAPKLETVTLPEFGSLHLSPFLLAFFLALSAGGLFLFGTNSRLGSLLFNTGYGVVTFLGAVGAMSLIWNFLTVKLNYRRNFPKLVFTLASLYFFSGSWMTILTILDSIVDFRNTTKKSLWHWIRYKVMQSFKEAE